MLAHYNVCLVFCQSKFNICVRCDMAFIEPMHRNKPNITYCFTFYHLLQTMEVIMASAELNDGLVCPLRTHSLPSGTHEYDPKWRNVIEQMHDHKTRRPGQFQRVSWHSRITWVSQQSSAIISRTVRQFAATCPIHSRITATSLLLRLQSSFFHWTISGT